MAGAVHVIGNSRGLCCKILTLDDVQGMIGMTLHGMILTAGAVQVLTRLQAGACVMTAKRRRLFFSCFLTTGHFAINRADAI